MQRWSLCGALLLFKNCRATLETCVAECALPERQRYCPVRSAPTQIFDGLDGTDVQYDLEYKTINFTHCKHANHSKLGFHWWKVAGQGYVTQGAVINELPDDPLGAGSAAQLANLSRTYSAQLSLSGLNTSSSFSYYDRTVDTVHILASGAIVMGTSSVAPPTDSRTMEQYLRSSYWPNLVICVLCYPADLGSGTRIFYEVAGRDTVDERLVISFAPSSTTSHARPSHQAVMYLKTDKIQLSWLDVSLGNRSVVVGLSHGITPEWKAVAYDALDFTQSIDCNPNPNCSVEVGVRPIGRTRPPATLPYPWAIAPPYNPHPQFCKLGCSFYYTNWTLGGCRAYCDSYYDYDVTPGYSDRAEVARYECYDGCAIGNLRCQPGFYCFRGEMNRCPPGKYRDNDYHHVTRCDDCPHGRYREIEGGRYLDACQKCEIGRHNSNSGSVTKEDCTLCRPGRFANEAGMGQCKCVDHLDGYFELTADGRVIYPECDPELYLDTVLRPEIESIDYSPRTTYP